MQSIDNKRNSSVVILLGLMIMCTCGFDGGCLGFLSRDIPTHISAQNTKYTMGGLVGATPRPYQKVYGHWVYDASGEGDPFPHGDRKDFGFNDPTITGSDGRVIVGNLRLNAYWQFGINFEPPCLTDFPPPRHIVGTFLTPSSKITDDHHDVGFQCLTTTDGVLPIRTYPYFDSATPPSAISIPSEVDMSGYPPSRISALVYDRNGQIVTTLSAAAVDQNGMNADFPAPSLVSDVYAVALTGTATDGSLHYLGSHSIVIGNTIVGLPRAFGVDGAVTSSTRQECNTPDIYNDGTYAGMTTCQTSNYYTRYPVISLYDTNEVQISNARISVGLHPTTVITYGSYSADDYQEHPCCNNFTDSYTSGTAVALVLNSGSDSVSVIDLQHGSLSTTIPVGSHPTAAAVSFDETKCYVVSDNGILTRIDLANLMITGSVYVGPHPTAVSTTQAGLVWVGGSGFISSLDGNALTIRSSQNVTGAVLALSSAGTDQSVFTTASDGIGGSGLGIVKYSANLAQSSAITSPMSASGYSSSPLAQTLTTPALMGSGMRAGVGALSYVVSTTPSGFQMMSGDNGALLVSGSVPGLTRSIGYSPDGSAVYFASPDSNSVAVVPLPGLPVENPNEVTFRAQ